MNFAATLPYFNPIYIHQPIAYIVKRLLKIKGVKIRTESLYQRLREHPYFPSLLSISDVLSEIGISNQAYKIELITLKENFESPVLTRLQLEQGLFCILDQIMDGKYRVVAEKGEVKWITENIFIKIEKWASTHYQKTYPLLYKNEDLEQWLETADVHSTPTFFINGYRLPKTYRIADIRYLISEVPLKYSDEGSPSLQTELI